MSSQTNNAYITKSQNGIISYDDGAGGSMEGGVITCNELIIDEIQSNSPPNVVSLFTDTTTIINVGSSTSILNVSNLNVSNINVPLVTFTTLNASTVNADDVNTSTMNSSTSNSSTSNSSTSNSSTSNSSTSNSSTANNGTTNSSTINVSTLNFGTTSGTTINMSTVNASLVNVNNIQGITATDDITLYTNTTGIITLGDTNTSLTHLKGSNILLESAGDTYLQTPNNLYLSTLGNTTINGSSLLIGANPSYTIGNITLGNVSTNFLLLDAKNTTISGVNDTTIDAGGEIYLLSNGNTEICNGGYGGKMILSGNQEIRAKDRSMSSYLFTDAFTGGNLYIGNLSSRVDINSDDFNLIANDRLTLKGYDISCNALGNLYMYGQSVRINDQTQRTAFLGYTSIGANASRATIQANGRDDLLLGSTAITGQVYIGGSGTLNATTINASTYNASTYNAVNINASSIITAELYSDYSELGNITFTNDTIDTLAPTSTVNLFPALTTGTLNIATNMTTTGAITMGNAASTGSFSLSEGIININPNITLNIANQIVSGTTNICNSNTYRGILNICATANVSNVSLNTINIGSSTCNLNFNCPLTPIYTPSAITVGDIGYKFSFSSNTVNGAMTTSATYYSSAIYNSVPAGVYILYWYNEIINNGANSVITTTAMAGGSTATNRNIFNQQCGIGNITLGAGRTFGFPITYPISITTAQAIHLSVMMIFSGGTLVNTGTTSAKCYMVRIA